MKYAERYKQTKKLKTVYKNNTRIHLRPSDRTLKQLELYKLRSDFQGNYQQVIARMVEEYTEKMNLDDMARIEPALLVRLQWERDRQKWIDLIVDENLCAREIDAICCSLQTAKERMEREK